jgi:hypothetical protein
LLNLPSSLALQCAQLPALSKHTMYLNWCGIEVGSAMQISVASMACPVAASVEYHLLGLSLAVIATSFTLEEECRHLCRDLHSGIGMPSIEMRV